MAVHLPLLANFVSINMYHLYICTYRFSAREGVVLRDSPSWTFPAIFTHSENPPAELNIKTASGNPIFTPMVDRYGLLVK